MKVFELIKLLSGENPNSLVVMGDSESDSLFDVTHLTAGNVAIEKPGRYSDSEDVLAENSNQIPAVIIERKGGI